MRRIIKHIKEIFALKAVMGHEVFILPDGKYLYRSIVIRRNASGLIRYEDSKEGNSLGEIINKNKTFPVSLVLNGKGILHKKLVIDPAVEDQIKLQKVLPNAKLADFYIQQSELYEDGTSYLSVIRRELIENVIGEYAKLKVEVISINLGPFVANNLFLLSEQKTENELAGNYVLSWEQNRVAAWKEVEAGIVSDPSTHDTLPLNPFKLAFAAGVSLFTSIEHRNSWPIVVNAVRKFYEERKWKQIMGGVLIFLFVALFINFLIFAMLNSQKNKKQAELNKYRLEISEYDKLQKDIALKSKYLQQSGYSHASTTSYFADQIAMDVPKTIRLSEISIQPVLELERNGNLSMMVGKIRIAGYCSLLIDLNKWVEDLKRKQWVKEIQLEDYKLERNQRDGKFTLFANI